MYTSSIHRLCCKYIYIYIYIYTYLFLFLPLLSYSICILNFFYFGFHLYDCFISFYFSLIPFTVLGIAKKKNKQTGTVIVKLSIDTYGGLQPLNRRKYYSSVYFFILFISISIILDLTVYLQR